MTGIFFGSTMGTTEAVAADIAKQLGVTDADKACGADAGHWIRASVNRPIIGRSFSFEPFIV